jgi:large subunit ribosomal protein L7Ae
MIEVISFYDDYLNRGKALWLTLIWRKNKMAEDNILEAIEVAKATGKIKKGSNEVTKTIEKGLAKMVAYAKDVEPKEVIMHIPLLCKEKDVLCFEVATKEELGAAAGIEVGTAAIAIVEEGESKALIEKLKPAKEEAKEE